MGSPVQPVFDPQAAWEALVRKGVSREEAAQHVFRQVQNQPPDVRQQYLKDVDPGTLASFGLGAADAMSFGLGDQVAKTPFAVPTPWGMFTNSPLDASAAKDTQTAAMQEHPTAHTLGEIAGVIGPAGAEYGLAKAGVLAPTAVGRALGRISNRPLRAAANTGVNALMGAGYAGAQAAGHTEGSLGERLQSAELPAAVGAVLGAGLPIAVGAGKAGVGGFGNRWLDNVAGPVTAPASKVDLGTLNNFDLTTEGVGTLRPQYPATRTLEDPLEVPTYLRRRTLEQQVQDLTPSGAAPTVPTEPPAVGGRPGHPLWYGEKAPTRSPEVRGGAPLTPSAAGVPGSVSAMPPAPASMVAASRPLAEALGQASPEPFTGGGFKGVTQAMQSPAYQQAGMLASRAVAQAYPPFNTPGMTVADATAMLQRMILEHVQRGGEIPALTSIPKFLSRLQPTTP